MIVMMGSMGRQRLVGAVDVEWGELGRQRLVHKGCI
jgi:hypothetical protein